ncbi:MAG: hypothetical protein ACRYGP_20520 [Janthinobacterium lividum]
MNARKCDAARDGAMQHVTVIDGHREVKLELETSTYPAGLTPDQARMLARQLVASARRVEAQPAATPPSEGGREVGT